ncbi:MAG: ABC transporter ATP-binding protein/permease [Lachnospiraceae bacterium]|nr:ABC transporter ATP-binding protein/permease [Lachnospiraceae bacterium]
MTREDKNTAIRFLGLLKDYRGRIVLLMAAILLSVGLSLLSPLLSRELMDKGLFRGDFAVIFRASFLLFLLRQVSSLLSLWIERRRLCMVYDFRFRMEAGAVEHLLGMRTEYLKRVSQSELLSQIDVDVNYICSILNTNTLSVFAGVFTVVGGIAAALCIHWGMVILILLVLPVKYLIIHFHSGVQKKKLQVFLEKNMAYARWFGELVGGMVDIRIYGLEKKKMEEFRNCDGEKIKAHRNMDTVSQYRQLADGTLDAVLNFLVFVVGGIFVARGELSVGSLYAFISYSSYILNPLSSILNLRLVFANILPSAARFFEFLDREEESVEGKENIPSGLPLALDIEYRDVFFRYQATKSQEDVIRGLCLRIPEGEKVALIGKNGCGKSTMVMLLLRLYDCGSGCILLGGAGITGFHMKEYRKLFSVVSQQIYLFHDTIRNNICMGREFDDGEIKEVLCEVGLEELVLERGLHFMVGINGSCLSGGQKQKVALARALLHDRPIFIFDEATSNTDIDFEVRFRRMLKGRLSKKTVLMVTHNAELLKETDRVVWMEEGKVFCEGAYGELLEQNTAFAGLIEQYGKGEENFPSV